MTTANLQSSLQRDQFLEQNIRLSYVFRFLQYFHLFAGVLVPFFLTWGGIPFHKVMIVQTVSMLFSFLLEVPTGAVADRFGLKASLVLSGLVGIVAPLVYASYPSFWIFILGEFVWGICMTLASGADQAIIYDSLKEMGKEDESKKIFGRWGSMLPLSMIVAAPLGSFIAREYGLRASVLLVSVPMFFSMIVALFLTEPATKSPHEQKKYLKVLKEGVRIFKNHRTLKILASDYVSITALAFLIIWLNQLVLQKMGIAIEWFGFVFSAMLVFEMILMNSFDRLERIVGGKRRYALVSALIAGISCIVMAMFINAWICIVAIILMGGFGLSRMQLMLNYMNKHIDSNYRATVLSTISMCLGLCHAGVRLVCGYMVDWNLQVTLIAVGGLIIIFAIISRVEEGHLLE